LSVTTNAFFCDQLVSIPNLGHHQAVITEHARVQKLSTIWWRSPYFALKVHYIKNVYTGCGQLQESTVNDWILH